MAKKSLCPVMLLILLTALFLSACEKTSVSELRSDEMLQKEVTVKGVVKEPFRFNKIDGWILIMEDGELIVSTEQAHEKGQEASIIGTIMKDPVVGYYLVEKKD